MSWLNRLLGDRQAKEAADQMFAAIAGGASFEVPQSFSTDDPTIRAVLYLRRKYGDRVSIVLQGRGMVLTRNPRSVMSPETHRLLDGHGYFPDPQLTDGNVLLRAHESFMRTKRAHVDDPVGDARREADKKHKEEVTRRRIVI